MIENLLDPEMSAVLGTTGLSTRTLPGATPIHYLERAGEGSPLLCLHGLGDSSWTFPEFVSAKALSSRPVLIPDIPGFGRSPRRAEATRTLAGQARAVLDFLHALSVQRFVVIGHSMGGAVGTHLAEITGARCLGLVSIEGNLTLSDCTLSAEAFVADRGGRYEAWRREVPPRMQREGEREPGKRRFLPSFLRSDAESYLEASRALVEESTDSHLGRRYAALAHPRLYLHGAASSPRETLAFIAGHGLDDVLYAGAGHWAHWDAREAAARDTATFLASLA